VSVRDKLTHEPVAGAVVQARSLNAFVPWAAMTNTALPFWGPDPLLDGSPPKSPRGVTGADGTVRLDVVVDHPVQVIAIAAGYVPQTIHLEAPPIDRSAPSGWLDADPGPALPDEPRRLEIRFSP
jgi:hypothetical protein